MTPERQRLAEGIFKEACARPADARREFIESKCGSDALLLEEVRSLLSWFENSSGVLDNPPPLLDRVTEADAAAALLPPGGKIGHYKILSVLGVGGMGVVYVAEQMRPQRTVALKVIRPGLASPSVLRRLEYEAELLGRLQHPGIAQVIEAGTADAGFGPQPFFAMELVKGSALNVYCDEKKLGTRDRLRLMERVCDAVEHAHRRGVIHRDLKPANILVDESGQPKILDFGVARASGGREGEQRLTMLRTGERQLIGTLAYMSPEQVSGDPEDVDFRSDVYPLGVILYELLAGRPPHDLSRKALPDAMRVIRDQDPARLGTVNTSFRGDLDTIAAKALEKDKARRYQSAAELAEDIRRSLENLPIAARPPSAVYQITKFTKRHRAVVAGASLAVLALVTGLVVSTVQYARAREAAVRSDQVANLLKGMIGGIHPKVAQARDTTLLKDIVDNTAKGLSDSLRGQPAVEGELRNVLGEVYDNIGEYATAEEQYRLALDRREKAHGRRSNEVAGTLIRLSGVLDVENRPDEAIAAADEALAIRRSFFGPKNEEVADALANAGQRRHRKDPKDAVALLQQSAAMYEGVSGPESALLGIALEHLGQVQVETGHAAEGEKALKRSYEIRKKLVGPEHFDTVNVGGLLGDSYVAMQRFAEAEPYCRKYTETMARLMPATHPTVALAWAALAQVLAKQGKLGDATALYRAQIAPLTSALGADDQNVGTLHSNLGGVLVDLGALDEAEREYTEAMRIYGTTGAKATLRMPFALYGLANVQWGRGKFEESAALARRGYDIGTRTLPAKHTIIENNSLRVAACETELAFASPSAERAGNAAALARQAVDDFEQAVGKEHFNSVVARARLACANAAGAVVAANIDAMTKAESELLEVREFLEARPALGAFPVRDLIRADLARTLQRLYGAWEKALPGKGKREAAEREGTLAEQIRAGVEARRREEMERAGDTKAGGATVGH